MPLVSWNPKDYPRPLDLGEQIQVDTPKNRANITYIDTPNTGQYKGLPAKVFQFKHEQGEPRHHDMHPMFRDGSVWQRLRVGETIWLGLLVRLVDQVSKHDDSRLFVCIHHVAVPIGKPGPKVEMAPFEVKVLEGKFKGIVRWREGGPLSETMKASQWDGPSVDPDWWYPVVATMKLDRGNNGYFKLWFGDDRDTPVLQKSGYPSMYGNDDHFTAYFGNYTTGTGRGDKMNRTKVTQFGGVVMAKDTAKQKYSQGDIFKALVGQRESPPTPKPAPKPTPKPTPELPDVTRHDVTVSLPDSLHAKAKSAAGSDDVTGWVYGLIKENVMP